MNEMLPAQTARRARAAREQGPHAILLACCVDALGSCCSCLAVPRGAANPALAVLAALAALASLAVLHALAVNALPVP